MLRVRMRKGRGVSLWAMGAPAVGVPLMVALLALGAPKVETPPSGLDSSSIAGQMEYQMDAGDHASNAHARCSEESSRS